MKVGDLVIRKKGKDMSAMIMRQKFNLGIILSKQPGGIYPVHPCITVYYPSIGKTWDIAESLMEVVSESR